MNFYSKIKKIQKTQKYVLFDKSHALPTHLNFASNILPSSHSRSLVPNYMVIEILVIEILKKMYPNGEFEILELCFDPEFVKDKRKGMKKLEDSTIQDC